jgi:hypothetical protein
VWDSPPGCFGKRACPARSGSENDDVSHEPRATAMNHEPSSIASRFTFPDSRHSALSARRSASIRNSHFAIRNVSPSAFWSPHVSLFTFPDSRHSALSARRSVSPLPRVSVPPFHRLGSRLSALGTACKFAIRHSQSDGAPSSCSRPLTFHFSRVTFCGFIPHSNGTSNVELRTLINIRRHKFASALRPRLLKGDS